MRELIKINENISAVNYGFFRDKCVFSFTLMPNDNVFLMLPLRQFIERNIYYIFYFSLKEIINAIIAFKEEIEEKIM